jgi:predicted anti-sigma-YlaC factor YlaD
MKGLVKYHTTVTTVQFGLITLSLCISSLGAVIKHPSLVYFWYLGLFFIGMMLATSLLVAVILMLTRIFKPQYARSQKWFTGPNSIRT